MGKLCRNCRKNWRKALEIKPLGVITFWTGSGNPPLVSPEQLVMPSGQLGVPPTNQVLPTPRGVTTHSLSFRKTSQSPPRVGHSGIQRRFDHKPEEKAKTFCRRLHRQALQWFFAPGEGVRAKNQSVTLKKPVTHP